MEKKMYSVQIGDEIRQYEAGTTYRQIAAEHQKDYEDDIVLVLSTTGCRNCIRRWKETASCGLRLRPGRSGIRPTKEA